MTEGTEQVSVIAASVPDWITQPEITGWDIALAIVVILASWILSRMAFSAAGRLAARLDSTSDNQRALAARMAKYFVLVLGIGIAISILGAPIQPVLAAAIIVAVVIALALRGVADNFAAGVILQSRKPIQVGDFVASQDYAGVVIELNGRSVVLDLLDGSHVHLPNSELLANPLVNKSVNGAVRCEMRVRADWRGDPDEIRQLLTDTARTVPGVVTDPSPQAFLEAVEPDRVRLLLAVWHQPSDRPTVASATVASIAHALRGKATKAAVESTAPPPPTPPASAI